MVLSSDSLQYAYWDVEYVGYVRDVLVTKWHLVWHTSFSLLAFKDFTALSKIGYILAISPKKSNKNARSI